MSAATQNDDQTKGTGGKVIIPENQHDSQSTTSGSIGSYTEHDLTTVGSHSLDSVQRS